MKPQKVQPMKSVRPLKPMRMYDEEAVNDFPGNLARTPVKRSLPRVLIVCPKNEHVIPGTLLDVIPTLREVHSVRDVPKKGFRFIIVVRPKDVAGVRKICPNAIIIGANGSDRYGVMQDYEEAGADGYWLFWEPNDMLNLILRI